MIEKACVNVWVCEVLFRKISCRLLHVLPVGPHVLRHVVALNCDSAYNGVVMAKRRMQVCKLRLTLRSQ
jgi:hypothetical protein